MGRLHIVMTINWEGRSLSGVEALARLRERFPRIPLVHFVSAAYFARGGDYGAVMDAMLPAFGSHDEIGLLLNGWQSVHGATMLPGRPAKCIVEGRDPILEIAHVGAAAQRDSGYTRALSAFPEHDVDAWIRNSKLLLSPLLKRLVKQPGVSVDAMLRGVRAGHGMANDMVLELVQRHGFAYDASAYDATWALRHHASAGDSPFAHWSGMLAQLWGPDEQSARELANARCREATAGTGIDWRTQPFYIVASEEGELLEMPINGGMIPPVAPAHLLRIAGALAKQAGATSYLSFGIHQDTCDREMTSILERIFDVLEREHEVTWCTLRSIADGLVAQQAASAAIHMPNPLKPIPTLGTPGPLMPGYPPGYGGRPMVRH